MLAQAVQIIQARRIELLALALFVLLTAASIIGPFDCPILRTSDYAPVVNTAQSIGTSGVAAFIFFYFINERLEHERRSFVRVGALRAYRDAKHDLAWAILQASRNGGRSDLQPSVETVEQMLTVEGFRRLFEGGHAGDEGFYAFENEMSQRCPEFDEIIRCLRVMGRAINRIIDAAGTKDRKSYDLFVRVDALLERIERNGPGYDESKPLCGFIFEIFGGWSQIEGWLGYDPVERAIARS